MNNLAIRRFEPVRSLMVVGAHPDDESVMAGGTLAMCVERGIHTHILCVTDGSGGEGASNPDDLARIRTRELAEAAKALGTHSVMLLRYTDPVMGPGEALRPFTEDEAALAVEIADVMWVRGVDVVLTHGTNGEYGHPAHQQVHRAVLRAVEEHLPHVLVYSFAALVPGIDDRLSNQNDLAHLALDISPWIETKHNALLAHKSQHDLFKRRRHLGTVREAIRTVEAFHRHWPRSHSDTPHDAFTELMLEAGAWRPTVAGTEADSPDA